MCDERISKRAFLAALAAAGAVASAPGVLNAKPSRHRIDVHYHHMAPAWISDEVVQRTLPPPVIARAKAWTPERAIHEMDRNGVETALCSVSNPGVWFGEVQQARRLARQCNEYAARMAHDHAGRFGSFAAIPLPDTEGSLAEIAHALDVLKADGIGLFTSYGDKWLADPAFKAVFEELNRRQAVIYVHPTAPTCCRNLVPNIPAALIEYPVDTTRALFQWILSGSSERFPGIRLIFSHAGGFTMGGLGRITLLATTMPQLNLPSDLARQVRKFYYEISSSADATTMTALLSHVPISQVLLGTDSPFIGSMEPNIGQLERLNLSAAELILVERENAVALIPGLRRSSPRLRPTPSTAPAVRRHH